MPGRPATSNGRNAVIALLLAAMYLVLAACASGPPPPRSEACASCDVSFAVCRKKDDYDPCRSMQGYCLRWCAEGETCQDGCDGALWGCQASDLLRSTCDAITEACQASCGVVTPAGDAGNQPDDAG